MDCGNHNNRRSGFTLIELSIVLIVIGLLIGGVLVARSMIKSAEFLKIGTEMQQYVILWRQFNDKFRYYPGDVPYSAIPFGACASEPLFCQGDGNGIYTYTSGHCCSNVGNEQGNGFAHLSYAGMLKGKTYTHFTYADSIGEVASALGNQIPELPNGIGVTVTSADIDGFQFGSYSSNHNASNIKFKYAFRLGKYYSHFGGPQSNFFGPALSPSDALALDSKFDDGHAYSGNVQAQIGVPYTHHCKQIVDAATPFDINDGHYDYLVSSTEEGCVLYWGIDTY